MRKAAAKVRDQTTPEGFISPDVLIGMEVTVSRKPGPKKKAINVKCTLLELTDEEFLEWFVKQIDGMDTRNRLRFRMFLLAGLEEVCGFKELHWKEAN